ncbi:MAG: bifunctional hydroxymethylpyrimidine kinase/phosphomethylpyrimidine kinase [Deltaproteobacteria bacterium]|nr:bifunctional hydroxymethylpyrimidine kinase/phosphomethylpyrimidine kinase [Deltaproteobacteria bacterium]
MTKRPSSLLVVGSVALDDLDGPQGIHPDVLGGSASYFATAASFFVPASVQLVAVVGNDFPQAHVDFFVSRGIDVAGLERQEGKTFRWSGRYSDDLTSRTSLDTQLGVFAGFRPRLSDHHRSAEFLFLGNIDPVLQMDVLEQVRRPRLVACDTMNFWISGKPEELKRTLARVDLLVINDEEARQLAGVHNLVQAVEIIRKLGPRGVVVKRGDSGALLFYEGGVFAAPAYPLEQVRDPTGAGDTFAGGLMGYLARCGEVTPATIRRAMIYGSVLASYCVEDFSLDRLKTLTLEDIASRFRAFYELTHFEHIAL